MPCLTSKNGPKTPGIRQIRAEYSDDAETVARYENSSRSQHFAIRFYPSKLPTSAHMPLAAEAGLARNVYSPKSAFYYTKPDEINGLPVDPPIK